AFLFQGDDVDKKVEVLSGGEKSRLALAKMIISPANLLIMDEPTNHLDMTSQDILQDALGQYDGSIIVVSHNRFFLDQFVNKVLEIKDGSATLFEGNISYYLEKARERAEAEKNDDAQAAKAVEKTDEPKKSAPPTQTRGKKARQAMAKVRQEKNQKIGPLKKNMVKLEEEIEKLESRKEELEKTLADPELYKDQELFADQSIQYGKIEKKLNRTYQKWETTQGEIDKIEASFENSSPLS
ncbi:MAG: ATP-binding cassette domain-containing protein, partial [Desulfobulbaceae bacterium]|nr:ATP-binding cassette domain-containing protein [Desulfobulbaceae bacterium]